MHDELSRRSRLKALNEQTPYCGLYRSELATAGRLREGRAEPREVLVCTSVQRANVASAGATQLRACDADSRVDCALYVPCDC